MRNPHTDHTIRARAMNDAVVLDSSLYEIYNLNVISSTKINQKVTQILRIFGVLPPVSSAQNKGPDDEAVSSKDPPGKTCTVVIIRAKANVASKLISIVEILKRDLARRASERAAHETTTEAKEAEQKNATHLPKAPIPRLYQYTSVTTIPTEIKTKPAQPESTQPLSTAPPAPEDPQQQGTKRKRSVDSSQDSTTNSTAGTRTSKKQKQHDSLEDEPGTAVPDEDEAEDFEVMAHTAGKDAGAHPAAFLTPMAAQMRDIPLLTVYLCSAPVAVLDEAFGEQVG